MVYVDFRVLNRAASSKEKIESSLEYLAENLRVFLRPQDRVLICFPDHGADSLGNIFARAVGKAGAVPVFWGKDVRWKTLLRIAFTTRASAIAAPPLVALGLTKLAKATGTPLYIRNVLTAGYPCMDWMIDGIRRGFDCMTWGCFGPGIGALVSGFSCGKSRGVHIRSEEYAFEIVDDKDMPLSAGSVGNVVLYPHDQPQLRFRSSEYGRLDLSPCECGCPAPRLMDIGPGRDVDLTLAELGQQMLYWTSVLDCRLEVGECGLEMELVVFPGEKLPKLPTCAKQIIRPWDPERDAPMMFAPGWIKSYFSTENH